MISTFGAVWFVGAFATFAMGLEEAIKKQESIWIIWFGALLCAIMWPLFLCIEISRSFGR